VFRHFGDRLFGKYARQTLANIERLSEAATPAA